MPKNSLSDEDRKHRRFRNFLKGWAVGLVGGYLLIFSHITKIMTIKAYGCPNTIASQTKEIPAFLSFLPDIFMFVGLSVLVVGPLYYWVFLSLKK